MCHAGGAGSDKRDLEERLAFLAMELERTRAKVSRQVKTP